VLDSATWSAVSISIQITVDHGKHVSRVSPGQIPYVPILEKLLEAPVFSGPYSVISVDWCHFHWFLHIFIVIFIGFFTFSYLSGM